MQIRKMRLSFVGAGNVATHLAKALHRAGYAIDGVYSRTMNSASALAEQVGAVPVADVRSLPHSDVYVFAVKDDVLPELAGRLGAMRPEALLVHTAGSVPMSVFRGKAARYGVLYPLQTFSKERAVDFREVPCFVEGSDAEALQTVTELAGSISGRVQPLDSDNRSRLHLAAVFACNFVNHCYAVAADILARSGVEDDALLPLVAETANKVRELSPRRAQTGPAVRYDTRIIAKHAAMLKADPLRQRIYELMSESIHDFATDDGSTV